MATKGRVQKANGRDGYLAVSVSRLEPDTVVEAPIYDDREDRPVLLLSAGTRITATLLDKIHLRGIESVRIHRSELARMDAAKRQHAASPTTRRAKPEVLEEAVRSEGGWGIGSHSFAHQVTRHSGEAYDPELVQQFENRFQSSFSQTTEFFDKLASGSRVDDKVVMDISNESVLQIAKDSELFVSLGISPNTGEYPMQHSLKSSMLAMSIGTTLGLSQDELIELGSGSLLHDVGMLRIDRALYESERVLDPIQFLEITKHPTYTFEMIREMGHLPIGARMIAYQTHERCNGSGYPRKRKKDQIHYLARIAAVADAFVAMISPRPYRPAYIPYHGLEEIIRGTRHQLFDPDVVRALLRTISLFPIGSFVQMSDGRVGKVIRANGDDYTRPVVELWHPAGLDGPSETVDLRKVTDLSIKAALADVQKASGEADAEAEMDNWE